MKKIILFISAVFMLLSSACTHLHEKVNKDIDYATQTSEDLNDQSKIPIEKKPALEIKSTAWIGLSEKKAALPEVFHQKLMLNLGDPLTLSDLAEMLINVVNIPVIVELNTKENQDQENNKFTLHFRGGTLENLLDLLTSKVGVNWEYIDGKIYLSDLIVRSYQIYALPGSTSMSSRLTSANQANASGTGANTTSSNNTNTTNTEQKTEMKVPELSVWKNLEQALKSMLSPDGKYSVSEVAGIVTVKDRRETHKMIEEYIKTLNYQLTMQIFLNVQVLSVQITDKDQYGIDWNLVAHDTNGQINLFNAMSDVDKGAGYLSANVLNHSLTGSKAFIRALSKQGKVSQVTSATIATLNNQPAPIQIGNQKSYLASISANAVEGAVSSSLSPGIINTGFNMTVVPSVLRGKQLVLQINVSMSELVDLSSVSSGNNTIQTPNIDTRDFVQRVRLAEDQTLVITGFEQTISSAKKKGIGKPSFFWLGGGRDAEQSRAIIVILITPILNQELPL